MTKFKKFLTLLACTPLFLSACVQNNGLCMCEEKVDLNYDGICDNCGKAIEGMCVHQDADGDKICDICGEEIVDPSVGPVEHKTVKGISDVVAPPTVIKGSLLAVTSVTVKVTYTDESTETKNPSEIQLDTSAAGTVQGKAIYEGHEASFSIEVVEPPQVVTVTSISDVSAPAHIVQDGVLAASQVTIVAHYSDGSTETTHPESVSLDTSTPGENVQGSVTFKEQSATFAITVDPKESPEKTIVSLGDVTAPEKVIQNSVLDKSEVRVVVFYSDETSESVIPDSVIVSTAAVGATQGVVICGGFFKFFDITVVGVVGLEVVQIPAQIQQYSVLSTSDITVKLTYSDGTEENVHPDTVVLNTNATGLVEGSFSVGGFVRTFSITVFAPDPSDPHAIVSISNVTAPTTIEKGATLSVDQVSFTVTYNNGDTSVQHPDSITLNTSLEGSTTGTVHYQGFNANFTITVVYNKVLDSITSVSAPSTIAENATLKVTEVTLYVAYKDGSNGTVNPDSIDLDTSSLGEKEGKVHYQGMTADFNITVVPLEQVTVYLVLTSVGLYKGEKGNSFDTLYLENTIAYVGVPGSPLPGKDDVTHKYGNCDFESWLAYEGNGFPTVYTTVPYENNKILYANFVENDHEPVDPGEDVDPGDPITPVDKETYYLVTSFPDGSGDWDVYEAQKMYAYVWKGENNRAYEMTWDHDRTWKVDIASNTYEHIIFCRVDPSATAFEWSKVFNQTIDMDFVAGKHTAQVQSWGAGPGALCPVSWIS